MHVLVIVIFCFCLSNTFLSSWSMLDCGLDTHRQCEELAPACLGAQNSIARMESSTLPASSYELPPELFPSVFAACYVSGRFNCSKSVHFPSFFHGLIHNASASLFQSNEACPYFWYVIPSSNAFNDILRLTVLGT